MELNLDEMETANGGFNILSAVAFGGMGGMVGAVVGGCVGVALGPAGWLALAGAVVAGGAAAAYIGTHD